VSGSTSGARWLAREKQGVKKQKQIEFRAAIVAARKALAASGMPQSKRKPLILKRAVESYHSVSHPSAS